MEDDTIEIVTPLSCAASSELPREITYARKPLERIIDLHHVGVVRGADERRPPLQESESWWLRCLA